MVFLDVELPGLKGLEAVKRIKSIAPSSPSSRVIMLIVFDDHDKIFKALWHAQTLEREHSTGITQYHSLGWAGERIALFSGWTDAGRR